jgi:hypothetical protein
VQDFAVLLVVPDVLFLGRVFVKRRFDNSFFRMTVLCDAVKPLFQRTQTPEAVFVTRDVFPGRHG